MSIDVHSQHPVSATWRDPKRYLWPAGLIVPLLPLMGWGVVTATGLGLLW